MRSRGATAKIVFTLDNGEEFNIPKPFKFYSKTQFLDGTMCYMYNYNNECEHSSPNTRPLSMF